MEKLIFVYNADSGLLNGLFDYAHKLVSPDTYACSLCGITYDNLGMKNDWKEFIKNLPIGCDFIYKNQLKNQYGLDNVALPAVFALNGKKLQQLATAQQINDCKTLNELQTLILKIVKN